MRSEVKLGSIHSFQLVINIGLINLYRLILEKLHYSFRLASGEAVQFKSLFKRRPLRDFIKGKVWNLGKWQDKTSCEAKGASKQTYWSSPLVALGSTAGLCTLPVAGGPRTPTSIAFARYPLQGRTGHISANSFRGQSPFWELLRCQIMFTDAYRKNFSKTHLRRCDWRCTSI
jgi:hypothetical protein